MKGSLSEPYHHIVTWTCPDEPPYEDEAAIPEWIIAEGQQAALDAQRLAGTYRYLSRTYIWDLARR